MMNILARGESIALKLGLEESRIKRKILLLPTEPCHFANSTAQLLATKAAHEIAIEVIPSP